MGFVVLGGDTLPLIFVFLFLYLDLHTWSEFVVEFCCNKAAYFIPNCSALK